MSPGLNLQVNCWSWSSTDRRKSAVSERWIVLETAKTHW